MGKLFDIENPLINKVNKIVDLVILNILWLASCVPVITAGTATSALYYAINKVYNQDKGTVWKAYWHAFRTNFKQSVFIWMITILAYLFIGWNCYITYQLLIIDNMIGALFYIFVIMLVFIKCCSSYSLAYVVRYEASVKDVLKNSVLFVLLNMFKSLLLFATWCGMIFLIIISPVLILLIPSVYILIETKIIEKVFEKYLPKKEDNMEY